MSTYRQKRHLCDGCRSQTAVGGCVDANVTLKFYNLFSTKQSTQSDKTHLVAILRPKWVFEQFGCVDDDVVSLEFIQFID